MKTKELNKKTDKELQVLLEEKRNSLTSFRFAIAGSKTRNVKEGNAVKKDIARIKTLQNSKK